MRKEINPIILIVLLVLVVGGAIAAFVVSNNASAAKVDLKKLDPADLRDDEPIKRGQPGYRERITDTPK